MNILQQIEHTRQRLHAHKGQYQRICELAGLDYSWLNKFSRGVYPNPAPVKVAALQDALNALEGQQAA